MEPPSAFVCPVSFELMKRPVRLAETGKVYEEGSIANWFALGKRTCPATGQTLVALDYAPDDELKRQIDAWIAQTGYDEVPETRPPQGQVSPEMVRKLMTAARQGDLNVVRKLHEEGLMLSVVDKRYHEFTALHYACQFRHANVMEYLIAHDVNVDCKDAMGLTPLHIASFYGLLSVVKLLLSGGANPNLQDMVGSTPLHLAARKGHKHIIRALLENDADKGIKDFGGDTPRDKAGLWGRFLIRRMLK